MGDTTPRSPGTKNQEFLGVSRSDPTTPRGGVLHRAAEAYVWGTSPSGDEKPLLVPLELAGKPLTRITNRKLGWVLGASTDVRAWIVSCLAPVSVSWSSPRPAADETRTGDKKSLGSASWALVAGW